MDDRQLSPDWCTPEDPSDIFLFRIWGHFRWGACNSNDRHVIPIFSFTKIAKNMIIQSFQNRTFIVFALGAPLQVTTGSFLSLLTYFDVSTRGGRISAKVPAIRVIDDVLLILLFTKMSKNTQFPQNKTTFPLLRGYSGNLDCRQRSFDFFLIHENVKKY